MSTHVNRTTERIIGAAIAVHRALGPGLLESAYKACLASELGARGLRYEREVEVPVVYNDVRLDCGYRMDLLVERLVVVELKVAARLEPVHTSQLLTYLRLSGCPAGLLINFNVPVLKAGIRRVVRGPHMRRPSETTPPSALPPHVDGIMARDP
jgi:GxxExxY protein